MNCQATRVDIQPRFNGGYRVTIQRLDGKVEVADELCFDEMLGLVARLMCPRMSDGEPVRTYGTPLFLDYPEPPKQTTQKE